MPTIFKAPSTIVAVPSWRTIAWPLPLPPPRRRRGHDDTGVDEGPLAEIEDQVVPAFEGVINLLAREA